MTIAVSFLRAFVLTGLVLAAAGLGIGRLLAPPPRALFRTSIFQMRLVEGWRCDREGGEFICTVVGARPANAIGILAMKVRGPQDTLSAYETHLARPKTWTDPEGNTRTSEVVDLTRARLAGHEWVSSLHFESELPGFFTRYLGTVTSHVGIIVTFSAAEDSFEQRALEFESMVDSLIVYQARSGGWGPPVQPGAGSADLRFE